MMFTTLHFIRFSLIALSLLSFSLNSAASCSVTKGSSTTSSYRYSIPDSCYTNAGWVAPVPVSSSGNLTTSTSYDYKSSTYTKNWGFVHAAVDWVGSSNAYTTNTPVYSIGDGIIKYIKPSTSSGRIHIEHTAANGTKFLAIYGHMDVKSGLCDDTNTSCNRVSKGETLGTLRLYGSPMHLHFELNTDSTTTLFGGVKSGTVNPMQFLIDNPATISAGISRSKALKLLLDKFNISSANAGFNSSRFGQSITIPTDVSSSAPYYDYIVTGYNRGVVGGGTSAKFYPDRDTN
ncbi:peptidoglycan DD-metalloendopeptidase family protein, partial [Candidatus Venteria ishoeyi]|uniref:peptidoglycan DD-metalloendopeptidase family protein n=1 Tax=Candidatus Venteria ishoeyi TaxID=1899563 RepID=UPI0011AFD5A0